MKSPKNVRPFAARQSRDPNHAVAFCVLQRLTFLLRVPPLQRAPFWTPGALIFTALLLEPPRRWWIDDVGLCVGVYAAYYDDDVIPVAMAMLAAQFGYGAAVLTAWGVRRFGTSFPFMSTTSLVIFVAFTILPVPVMLTAPVDLIRLRFGAVDAWSMALRSVLTAGLGMLIVTPALTLTVENGGIWFCAWSWTRIVEIGSLATGLALGRVFRLRAVRLEKNRCRRCFMVLYRCSCGWRCVSS